jgi:hypothetical protein
MIYLEETFYLNPASPENLDSFVDLNTKELLPIYEENGYNLISAWVRYDTWYGSVTHITELFDLKELKEFRIKLGENPSWGKYLAEVEEKAPERHSRILEPLGSIPVEVLHQGIKESREKPGGEYSLAILHATPETISDFIASFDQGLKLFPILASWRSLSGDPNEVIDLWKANLLPTKYEPANEAMKPFFDLLRVHAPKERMCRIYPLPYSPLR